MMSPTAGGRAGLAASIALSRARTPKASACGRDAGDALDCHEQGTGGLGGDSASVAICEVSHEARDACKSPARALDAPVVAVAEGREARVGGCALGPDTPGQPLKTAWRRCAHVQMDLCSQLD